MLPKALIVCLGLIVGFAALPLVYANHALLFSMMMYLALAQGINILYGFTGYLAFGYVGFFGAGAYATALSILSLHWTPWIAVLAGGSFAAALALVLSPLLRLSGAYFSIASLAASEGLYYLIANPHLKNLTRGPYGLDLAAAYAPKASYSLMLVVLAVSLSAVLYLRFSRTGLALQAIRDDSVSAAMAGVPVVRERTRAWLLSAAIAGLTGGAFAWHISVFYPETVFDLGISVFTIVFTLFGGAATVTGPIIGTLVLYGAYNWIGISHPAYFQGLFGIVIVLFVLFLPDGLVSLLRRLGLHAP